MYSLPSKKSQPFLVGRPSIDPQRATERRTARDLPEPRHPQQKHHVDEKGGLAQKENTILEIQYDYIYIY